MIIDYQRKKFAFTEFDEEGNEVGWIWKINDFYDDFPFLPKLNFDEIENINFDDERPLYIIVYFEKLNKEAVCGKSPNVHKFFQAIENNKQTIRNRAYELMNAQQESIEPDKDILDEYKTQVQSIISNLNNEVANLKSDVLILKHEVVNLKQGIKNGI
jgi:hypothetical protein